MKLVIAAALFAASCGSKSTSTAETTPRGEGSASAVLPDVPFEDLDHDQRVEFMKQKVVPTMKPIFQGHDPTDFAGFGCQTCHGDGFKQGNFEMPNPRLPKLNFANMGKFKREDVEWMKQQVYPTMGKLLRIPLQSADNPKGFSCLNCHTQEAAQPGHDEGHEGH
jgi:hypothetical protein